MLDITDPPEHPAVQTAYCLTVYNEPGRAILASLASLANAISYQQQRDPTPQEAFVTIIADGSEKISASAMQLFTAMGLLKSRQQILNSGTAYTIPASTIGFFQSWPDMHTAAATQTSPPTTIGMTSINSHCNAITKVHAKAMQLKQSSDPAYRSLSSSKMSTKEN